MKPVNIIQGRYFLGLTALPQDRAEREAVLRWYQLGVEDGRAAVTRELDRRP